MSVRKEQSRSIVPAEGNFEEHPYFRVGDRNAGTGIMHFENELRTRDGNVMQQSWMVRAAHGRGLPGRYDQDVYVALMQLMDAKGLPADGWVSFSVYELVELMGKRHSGREYGQVRESLQRLATTSIESKNAFYHKGRKAYISDTFSLLTEVKLAEYEGIAGERKDRNRVHLSQYFVDSYRARCTIAKARELRAGPVCSPFPLVWLTRLASSATSFQYRMGSISAISPPLPFCRQCYIRR